MQVAVAKYGHSYLFWNLPRNKNWPQPHVTRSLHPKGHNIRQNNSITITWVLKHYGWSFSMTRQEQHLIFHQIQYLQQTFCMQWNIFVNCHWGQISLQLWQLLVRRNRHRKLPKWVSYFVHLELNKLTIKIRTQCGTRTEQALVCVLLFSCPSFYD